MSNIFPRELAVLPVGQGCVLQFLDSVASPVQAAPPLPAGVSIVLVRVCKPVPHVTEHCVQLPKSPHTQSITKW